MAKSKYFLIDEEFNKGGVTYRLSQTTKLVQVDWYEEKTGRRGTAFGGFQRTSDFDLETAKALALSNAAGQMAAAV